MFQKFAKTSSLASSTYDESSESGFRRIAAQDQEGPRSYYVDGSKKIDVRAVLEKTADRFNISKDPADYIFEAIRANTVDIPNENHDAFSKAEMLSWDPIKRRAVYMTYEGKPHHLNHKADNPRTARGVIVDAHYNDTSPPADKCPSCDFATREASARDPSGIHCKRCGTTVKDEFVEILVAVDTKKDPYLANAIKTGHARAGSMGCQCSSTTCNVCQHVAYSVNEFCDHIKRGNKGSFWVKDASANWRRAEPKAIEWEFKKRGRKFVKDDFCWARIAPDESETKTAASQLPFEVRKAFEYCNQVEFDEYSRVDQPADPKALQIEILKAASKADETDPAHLEMESRLLVLKAQVNEIESRLSKSAQRMSPDGDLQVESDHDLDSALHIQTPEGDHFEVGDGAKIIEAPLGQEPPGFEQMPGPQQQQQMGQPPQGIEEVTDQEMMGPEGPQQQQQWEPEALGILPPAAGSLRGAAKMSRRLFQQDYGNFYAEVTPEGNALVISPAGPVMVLNASRQLDEEESRISFGREILASILADGLMDTFNKYDGTFSPRFAQILDAAVNEMAEYKTRPEVPSTKDQMDDMAGDARPVVKGLPDQINSDGVSELNKERYEMPSGSIEDEIMDHEDSRKTTYDQLSTIKDHQEDVSKERPSKSLSNTVLEGGDEMQKVKHKADLKVYAERLQKAAKAELDARVAKLEADITERVATKFAKALKVAARRFALDLEDSPLKIAMFDVLHTKQAVGRDLDSGEEYVIGPLSQELAVTLCQRAWSKGASAEIDALLKRATELMAADEKYLSDAEVDMSKQAISEPIIASASAMTVSEETINAEEMRREAIKGNLHLAPSPEVATEVGFGDKRASLREALSSRPNKVNLDLASLGQAAGPSL